MKDNNALQLIHSIRDEFTAKKFTEDYDQNESDSKLLEIIQTSGETLEGDEKILYDVLKDTYVYNYFDDVSWKIGNRTNLNSEDLSQIETWSTRDFKNYIIKGFKENDLKKEEMKKISFLEYKSLFDNNEDIEYFPTLNDWYLSQKIYFLRDSSLFTKNELRENQNTINAIYDELIENNKGNQKLYFMHKKLTENCRFTNYKNELEQLQDIIKSDIEGDYKIIVIDEVIDLLVDEGKSKEALEIAYQARQKYSDSPLFNTIQYNIDKITNPELRINYEKKTQSNRPIHVIADHKNVSDFILNIYEVKGNFEFFMEFSETYNESEELYNKIEKEFVRKEEYKLPDLGDYERYSTSVEIKPLPQGIYVAELSFESARLDDPETREKLYFIVSDNRIIYQNKRTNDIDSTWKLVNNENGKPIPNEEIIVSEYVSDKPLHSVKLKTDENGTFKFPESYSDNYYKKYLVQQPRINDYQTMEIYGRRYYNDEKNKEYKNTQIFTDRAIYRPGQTVYFKVINTQLKNNDETAVSGLKQKITLSDPNDQEISSQDFITNEFGSYHGSFVLPKGKLGGTFCLQTDGEEPYFYKYFKVEEYKRPKFEITFDPVNNEYKYGQTLKIKGKAVMFSGVFLSNVTVKYEIKKNNVKWKYFTWYSRSYDSESFALGEVETNKEGEFSISLYLEKDEYLEGIQIDNFEINASVTDINGETQSAITSLTVASVSHYIQAKEIENGFTDENVKIKVETKNFNDQNIYKSYHAKLVKLQSPERIFRNNFEEEVQDLPKFSKEEFVMKFPHDRFDESELKNNAEIEKIIIDQLIHTPTPEILDLGKLEAGDYQLELYDSQEKETIKISQKFSIWDKKILQPDQKTFLTVLDPKKEFSRGEKATVFVYSAIPDAWVNIYKQYGFGETISEIRQLENGVMEYLTEIPQDKSIDTVDLQFQIVAFNDVQTEKISLKIKEDEASLEIQTTTFRDKIQPNSEEKWSVKITGKDKEKIYAEVLANMYDLSLDQFAANKFKWQKMPIPNSRFTGYDINSYLSARAVQKRLDFFSGFSVNFLFFSWHNGRMPDHVRMVGGSASSSPATTLNEIPRLHKKIAKGDEKERGISGGNFDEVGEIFKSLENVQVRENLNETAFFYPDLKTDSDGNISFEFTSPGALTKWKLMFLAHTKDAKTATLEKEVITQKEFSVTPNYPRFLREGDELDFQSKLSNLTDKNLIGSASLQILDTFTNEDISSQFGLNSSIQNFELNENGNSALTWKIKVPDNISSIILKVVAKAGQYSDGEQNTIAILPKRILVTDTLPIFVKEDETKTFELENLKNTTSKTISNVSNTLELITNPIWEIIFSLPSLKNDQNNSADVIFNKWFADVLASEIFKANPRIKNFFDEYRSADILKSNLEKNEELKQILLEETPWILQSESETEIMNGISRLFEVNEMKNSIDNDWRILLDYQNKDGGFPWLPGYKSSYSNSLYILRNLGKMNDWLKENVSEYQQFGQKEMVSRLINYIDNELTKQWNEKEDNPWSNFALDYLNSRHYWEKKYPLNGTGKRLKQKIIDCVNKFKIIDLTFFGVHRMAILYHSYGLKDVSKSLINHLKETSVFSENKGRYWKSNLNDWGWYSSKIVNHAGAIEALSKIDCGDVDFIEESKIWLATQKEVNSWGNSRATAEIIFIMMNSGKSWTTSESDNTKVIWGGKEISTQTKTTGYLKEIIKSDKVNTNLGEITVTNSGPGIVHGGLFWQYYEDSDKIKSSENYISITKELYKKIKTVNREELQRISPEAPLKVGDKVTVRMILNTDRPMQYVHLKDMRAAGFEPLHTLSGYHWKNNLGYYQMTKDASTSFYIYYMPKGKYVLEYDLVCNASGNFSGGFATLQNYYAPQMNARTTDNKIEINK